MNIKSAYVNGMQKLFEILAEIDLPEDKVRFDQKSLEWLRDYLPGLAPGHPRLTEAMRIIRAELSGTTNPYAQEADPGMIVREDLSSAAATIGRKGGSVRSPAKRRAVKKNVQRATAARVLRFDVGGRSYVRVQPPQKRMHGGRYYYLCKPEKGRGKRLWLDRRGRVLES